MFRMENPDLDPDVVVKASNKDMVALMRDAGLTYGNRLAPQKVSETLKELYHTTKPQNVITYHFTTKDFKNQPPGIWECVDNFIDEAELKDNHRCCV